MSLREFHLFFIVMAALCCLFFGVWALWTLNNGLGVAPVLLAGSIIGFLGTIVTIVYGFWYWKKKMHTIII
jgi:hypothetical protein